MGLELDGRRKENLLAESRDSAVGQSCSVVEFLEQSPVVLEMRSQLLVAERHAQTFGASGKDDLDREIQVIIKI